MDTLDLDVDMELVNLILVTRLIVGDIDILDGVSGMDLEMLSGVLSRTPSDIQKLPEHVNNRQ